MEYLMHGNVKEPLIDAFMLKIIFVKNFSFIYLIHKTLNYLFLNKCSYKLINYIVLFTCVYNISK